MDKFNQTPDQKQVESENFCTPYTFENLSLISISEKRDWDFYTAYEVCDKDWHTIKTLRPCRIVSKKSIVYEALACYDKEKEVFYLLWNDKVITEMPKCLIAKVYKIVSTLKLYD